MISDTTRLKIAHVCYANVSSRFADFMNPKNRGENFTWPWFIQNCRENADLWIMVGPYKFRGDKREIYELAVTMSEEIAHRLVDGATR